MGKKVWGLLPAMFLSAVMIAGHETAFAGVNVIQKAAAESAGVDSTEKKAVPGPEAKDVGTEALKAKEGAAVLKPGGEFGPGLARDVIREIVARYGYDVDWSDVKAKEDESGRVFRFGFPIRVPGSSIEDDLRALSRSTGQRVKFVFDVWENSIVHVTVQE